MCGILGSRIEPTSCLSFRAATLRLLVNKLNRIPITNLAADDILTTAARLTKCKIIYTSLPTVLYRLHDHNLSGKLFQGKSKNFYIASRELFVSNFLSKLKISKGWLIFWILVEIPLAGTDLIGKWNAISRICRKDFFK